MSVNTVQAIVDAVLYEGYALYPYRAGSLKNRQRWTFGGLYPQHSDAVKVGAERASLQAQCLVRGGPETLVSARLGFLHPIDRQPANSRENGEFQPVPVLDVDTRRFVQWREAAERRIESGPHSLNELAREERSSGFEFSGSRELEPLWTDSGAAAGALIRSWTSLCGTLSLRAEPVGDSLHRITARALNATTGPVEALVPPDRADQALRVMLSAHLVLTLSGGSLVSAIDPPTDLLPAAQACQNIGCFPVLVGEHPQENVMLCSPIILHDYPQIAPQTAGDMFDSTEIDEILTLRILTMTDAEKREMAGLDERVARVLKRAESLTAAALARLHGSWRRLRAVDLGGGLQHELELWGNHCPAPECVRVGGRELRVNDRVRLRPGRNADILDLALAGQTATIHAIERDLENVVHVAVTVDEDPGRDLGSARMPGHRFFFAVDELEDLECAGSADLT